MSKIFISYSRQSEPITKTLAQDMDDLGHIVWYDQELSGGQSWWDQILANIRDCDIFVMVLDPRSITSVACKREYGYASELGKPILPVLVSSEVSVSLLPPALSKIQMVDYRNRDTNAAFKLARSLASIPPARPMPDPLPAPPEAPLSYLGELVQQVETANTLNYEEQSALLFKLKKQLQDPTNSDDARKLMASMRKRPDLLVSIADEIDEQLRKKSNADSQETHTKSNDNGKYDSQPQPSTLDKIIVGSWSVQISQLFAGSISATFIFAPNGSFSGQLYSEMGSIPVQGQWMVRMQMLSLNGYQTVAFMNYPYSAEITFMIITQNRLEGSSQAGESIVMQR
jgi:hypothetical protein